MAFCFSAERRLTEMSENVAPNDFSRTQLLQNVGKFYPIREPAEERIAASSHCRADRLPGQAEGQLYTRFALE